MKMRNVALETSWFFYLFIFYILIQLKFILFPVMNMFFMVLILAKYNNPVTYL